MKTFLLKVAGYRRRQTEVQASEPAVILHREECRRQGKIIVGGMSASVILLSITSVFLSQEVLC